MMSEDLLKVPQLCASFFRLLIFISDIAPIALAQVSDQMLFDFMQCVQLALDNVFGVERVRSALEIITNLTTQCSKDLQARKPTNQFLVENLLRLMPVGTDYILTHFAS